MATRTITNNQDGSITVTWANLLAGESGDAVNLPSHELVSVQAVAADWDTSGAVALQGSLAVEDGGTFSTMEDVGSNAVSFASADGLFAMAGGARWVKPVVTNDGAGSAIDVDVFAHFIPRI